VFDRVFGPDIAQDGIWEYVSDCVGAFLQGYNVSLLAYGQSGAGKSYTMGTSGPLEQADVELMGKLPCPFSFSIMLEYVTASLVLGSSAPWSDRIKLISPGVIPRAATALFEKLDTTRSGASTSTKSNRNSMSQLRSPARYAAQGASLGDQNWSLKATYVEIYNEQLRDLLIPEHVPTAERSNVTIREDVKGNILLTGLRQVDINSVDDLLRALNFGSTIRQTDATAINAKSSRSHAVFSLNLVQRRNKLQSGQGAEKRFSVPLEAMTGTEAWVTTDSKLHFVDLAGSERLKNTGAQGERAKEGISINAGLAALGKVISQLSSRQPGSHVSYRDSRLTRLLQDSLGGNAITYMIACVTPAEFHLSETLNTVQYAQRARAIQSKPRIQQVEDGDKQALIDRLKAEVAFLREQIRSAERGGGDVGGRIGRSLGAAGERSERSNEREVELQNQLLDSQENYEALSKRHAKLIAEMAKARDNEQSENQQQLENLEESLGDSATERLNRSNSFAQAVEQVVLEYEKTIQSLEQSLSSTRGTLSNTEQSLLEKETKCAYVETINTQLQARLQKLMDREASTENYLHDLENKLDGHTSGEEKNATIILELRKEIARVRENEAGCEDYISTLEERLAEADQDAELMQREIDRLEQVIERQRSLGKLDSLLYELDHIQQDKVPEEPEQLNGNGIVQRRSADLRARSLSRVSRQSQSHGHRDVIHEEEEDGASRKSIVGEVADQTAAHKTEQESDAPAADAGAAGVAEDVEAEADFGKADMLQPTHSSEYPPQSPAQSKFVQDKLETMTQELVDLRVEHEATLNEYDSLHAKYEDALRALAEMQDVVDESRHPHRPVRDSVVSVTSPTETRPDSFLSDGRSSDLKDGGRYSSSRSLSSELSSAMESPAIIDTLDETAKPATSSSQVTVTEDQSTVDQSTTDEQMVAELEKLKQVATEKEAAERELAEKYAQLEEKHYEALDLVEELKTEVSKAKAAEASSPRQNSPVIRRKSSQNVMIIDRAHRSFASLRNIAAENFEDNPDTMQNFELNLNAAMHELHARSERIQELEANVATTKKEMETKMTIISGLQRERSSLKASPRDISVVSTLRDQLEQNERQLKVMREAHETREKELTAELEKLRLSVEASSPGTQQSEAGRADGAKVAELEAELSDWKGKHKTALDNLHKTEEEMKKAIGELEGELAKVSGRQADTPTSDRAVAIGDGRNNDIINTLRTEVDEYKALVNSNSTKISELEREHAAAKAAADEAAKMRDLVAAESSTQKELIASLEQQLTAHEQAAKAHFDGLELLKVNHAKELHELRVVEQHGYQEQVKVLIDEHAENIHALEAELDEARQELLKVATQVAFALGVSTSVEKITERIDDLVADGRSLAEEQRKRAEIEQSVVELSGINDTIMRDLESVKASLSEMLKAEAGLPSPQPQSLPEQLAALKKKMGDLETKSKKNSRLVEELEDQLQSNYDQAQIANNRLSSLQTERHVQLDEANTARAKMQAELETIREEYAALQVSLEPDTFSIASCHGWKGRTGANSTQARLDDPNLPEQMKRSGSVNSQLRKSSSVASLPSPPPAIPLPPLPGSAQGASSPTSAVPGTPTGRPGSKDNMVSLHQIHEDQEARIQTIQKHLQAEKQLTATLEEALTELEAQTNKAKSDCDAWRKRAHDLESEVKELQTRPQQQQDQRWSVHAVEEERKKRQAAEAARANLEERMQAITKKSSRKKGSLNCF